MSDDFSQEIKNYNKEEIFKYLNDNFKVPNDKKSTHTSIDNPKGKWYVDDKYLDAFYGQLYNSMFKKNVELHLTEAHKEISPVLIDLDLRHSIKTKYREFNIDFIHTFIKFYIDTIKQTYTNIDELLEEDNNILDCYVLLKDTIIIKRSKFI